MCALASSGFAVGDLAVSASRLAVSQAVPTAPEGNGPDLRAPAMRRRAVGSIGFQPMPQRGALSLTVKQGT